MCVGNSTSIVRGYVDSIYVSIFPLHIKGVQLLKASTCRVETNGHGLTGKCCVSCYKVCLHVVIHLNPSGYDIPQSFPSITSSAESNAQEGILAAKCKMIIFVRVLFLFCHVQLLIVLTQVL